MKVNKTFIIRIIIGLFIAFIVANILNYLGGFIYIKAHAAKGERRLVRLLSQTDYQVLLDACRQLSNIVTSGQLKPKQYNVRYNADPEASLFPQPILDLEPTYVIIDSNGIVQIELYGGFAHYGVNAYPTDYNKPSWVEYGDKKLIDGLWFYDEDYKGNPNLQKKIDTLIEKGEN